MFKRLTEKNKLIHLGLFLGVVYGLITRLVFGEAATLVTLSYLFVVPAVLGVIPLVFASDEQIRSYKTLIFIPWLTVASVFLTLWLVGLEEAICLLILGAPFFIIGTIGALIYRLIRIHRDKRKILLTVVLIPFLFSPLEETVKNPSDIFTVTSEVKVNSTPGNIWRNIIRVSPIKDSEYQAGFFQYLGVPRPIEAELTDEKPGALRIGHFEGGLTFIEHITDWKPNERVSFDITVDPKTIRNRVFDQHVLSGGYFSFVNATYEIEPLNDQQVMLRLVSSYRLTSKVNFYNRFWGDLLLQDFQDRLLAVIKLRCDNEMAVMLFEDKVRCLNK